jgi:PAS domain-containing protein
MSTLDNSIVRIFDYAEQIIGSGFLVSQSLVMTCAHVVQASLSSDDDGKSVLLDFPLVDGKRKIAGQIIFLDNDLDVACIKVSDLLPNQAIAAPLVIADNLWGHSFRAFGFPQGHENGVWVSGVLRGYTGEGWLQIEGLQETCFNVQPGFSGGLVWDDQLQSVVGMIVAAEKDRAVKAAFCIPTRELAKVYPDLKKYSIVLCPYRSLDVFTENDKDLFFGRERVTSKLLASLKLVPHFLAISGPSGTGKSSLVKAGLIPALKDGKVSGSKRWQFLTIRPGVQPFEQLENVGLSNVRPDMVTAVNSWFSDHPSVTRLVIFIDQFEELLIVTPRDVRNEFITEIAKLLDSSAPITIIITLRDDFHVRFLTEARLLSNWYGRNTTYIPAVLEIDELYAMMVNPASKSGVNFEKGLTETIIKDAIEVNREKEQAESTILPLLEFALTQMWEVKRGNVLTHEDYQQIGGVAGGLSRWADKAYYDLNDEERTAARQILVALINFGNEEYGVPNTKRIRKYEEVARNNVARKVTQKLVQARLLVAGYDNSLKQNTLEIIHEALIYKWALMLDWIDRDKEFLRIYSQFTDTVREWEISGKDKGFLYFGLRLSRIIDALDRRKEEILSDLENEFLKESLSYDQLFNDTQKSTQNLEQLIAERTAQLHREQQNTETLLRIYTEVSSSLDLDRALNRTLALLNDAIGAEQGTIMLRSVDDNLLHYRAGYGYLSERIGGEGRGFKLKIGEGLAGWVVENRESALISDLFDDPRWVKNPASSDDYRSAIVTPLFVAEDVIGVLMVFHRKPGYFRAEILNVVKAIASQVAVAINNAHLYELVRDQAERLGSMLRREQEDASRSQAILEAVADGVLVTGINNRISFLNSSAEQILNLDSRVIGRPLDALGNIFDKSLIPWIEAIRDWSESPPSYQHSNTFAKEMGLKDGRVVMVHLAPVILQNDFLGTVSIFREIKKESN